MAASPGGVEVGRVSVRVLPDTSRLGADLEAKLKAIEKKLSTLDIKTAVDTATISAPIEKTRKEQESKPIKVPVKAGTDAMFAQVKAEALKISKTIQADIPITADGERLRQEIAAQVALIEGLSKIQIPVDLEGAAALRNKMAVELDLLKAMAARANPTVDIHTEIDTASLAKAETELEGASLAANGFSLGLGNMTSALLVLGPALIPVIAAVVALGAALVAPVAIVAGGLTVFGVIAGFTIAETQKQLKTISQLDTKLGTLTKGTAEYAATAAQLRAAQAALTPAQKAYSVALTQVKTAFNLIPKTLVLTPITDGLKLLAHVIPLVTPILKAVSGVVSDMLAGFSNLTRSAGFKTFVDSFAKQIGPDLRAFATIAGNVFQGLFGLFGAFNAQLSGSVLSSLENLTGKFAAWGQTVGQSKGFRSFVDYIKRVGPLVAAALGSIAGAAVAIASAFAPIGGVVLQGIKNLADAIQKIPHGVLVGLATAFVAMAVASKLLGPVMTLFEVIGAIAGGGEIALAVAAVVALAGGFVLLYQNSKPLRQVIGDLGDFFKTQLLPVIKNAAEKIFPAISSAFHDISKSIKDNKPFLEVMGKLLLVIVSTVIVAGIYALVAGIRLMGKWLGATISTWHLFADAVLIALRLLVGGFTLFVQGVLFSFGVIVDAAAKAFGWIPGIGPKLKAAQSNFHSFADGAISDLQKTSAKLKSLQDQIDGLHGKTLTIPVIVKEQSLERATGPGGGIGKPGQPTSTDKSGVNINIQNVNTTSTSDLIRHAQRAQRGRAGGGVVLAGSNR